MTRCVRRRSCQYCGRYGDRCVYHGEEGRRLREQWRERRRRLRRGILRETIETLAEYEEKVRVEPRELKLVHTLTFPREQIYRNEVRVRALENFKIPERTEGNALCFSCVDDSHPQEVFITLKQIEGYEFLECAMPNHRYEEYKEDNAVILVRFEHEYFDEYVESTLRGKSFVDNDCVANCMYTYDYFELKCQSHLLRKLRSL